MIAKFPPENGSRRQFLGTIWGIVSISSISTSSIETRLSILFVKTNANTDSEANSNDSKTISNHLRADNNKTQASFNKLPSEIKINDETITDSEVIVGSDCI